MAPREQICGWRCDLSGRGGVGSYELRAIPGNFRGFQGVYYTKTFPGIAGIAGTAGTTGVVAYLAPVRLLPTVYPYMYLQGIWCY